MSNIINIFPTQTNTIEKYQTPSITNSLKKVNYTTSIITKEELYTDNLFATTWTETSATEIISSNEQIKIIGEGTITGTNNLINCVDGNIDTAFQSSGDQIKIYLPYNIKLSKLHLKMATTYVVIPKLYGYRNGSKSALWEGAKVDRSSFEGDIEILHPDYYDYYELIFSNQYSSSWYSWTTYNAVYDLSLLEYYIGEFADKTDYVYNLDLPINKYENSQIIHMHAPVAQDSFVTKTWHVLGKLPLSEPFNDILCKDGFFVGITNSGTYKSEDGENWEKLSSRGLTKTLIYKDLFVGYSGATIYYSADGKTWTAAKTVSGGTINCIQIDLDNNLGVCSQTGADANFYFNYSSDGKTWTEATYKASSGTFDTIIRGFQKSGTSFKAFESTGYLLMNVSGTTISSSGFGSSPTGVSIYLTRKGQSVAMGSSQVMAAYQKTGSDWTKVLSAPTGVSFQNMFFDEELQQFVVVGTGSIFYSSDGLTWEQDIHLNPKDFPRNTYFKTFSYNKNTKIKVASSLQQSNALANHIVYTDGYKTTSYVKNAKLNINNLGEKSINGELLAGQNYDLIYNGEKWNRITIKEEYPIDNIVNGITYCPIIKIQDGDHIKIVHVRDSVGSTAKNAYVINGLSIYTASENATYTVTIDLFYSNNYIFKTCLEGTKSITPSNYYFTGNDLQLYISNTASTDKIIIYKY